MPSSALDYLRTVSSSMETAYPDNCVVHARRIAELLLAEGKAPWIGRLRDVTEINGAMHQGPLIPRRFATNYDFLAWSTHYVACAGNEAYDPLAGEPVPVKDYALQVFRKALTVVPVLDPQQTAAALTDGSLSRLLR